MNTYSRALKHISMRDVKQKHRKKLAEKKIKEEKEKQNNQYLLSLMESKRYDWRKELSEQMTSADLFYTNLPSEGEVDLVSNDVSINFSGGTPGEIGSPSEGFYARTTIIGPVDTTRYDTLGITVTVNSSIDYGEGLVLTSVGGLSGATLILSPGSTSGTYYARLPSSSSASSYRLLQFVTSTGSSTFTINKISYQRRNPKNVFVSLDSPEATSFIRTDPAFSGLSEAEKKQKLKEMLEAGDEYVMKMLGADFPGTGAVPPGESGDISISGVQVTDIPTAKSGIFTKQKSDAFMKGWNQGRAEQGLPPMDNMGRVISTNKSSTSSSISKSADQRAIDTLKKEIETRTKLQTTGDAQKYYSSPSMQKALDRLKVNLAQQEKDFADKYGSTEMPRPGPQELEKQLSDIDKQIKQLQKDNERIKADANRRNWELAANLAMDAATAAAILSPIPGDEAAVIGVRSAAQTAKLARNFQRQNPGKYNPFLSDKANQLARQQGVGTNVKGQKPAFRNPLKNSYEPEGQLISEKKLKSPQEVLNKIPGYYDGKPAPLGFPVEPPPEMKNGMHPDLVDGKKVADRFNRLDPESAKAMPLTGNPHVDKKVKAARKKPK